jgi:FixJ family two-component response regulator
VISERAILVVEDDESLRGALESFLGAAGFTTIVYVCAEAMLAGGKTCDALCVISDVKLPAMSGLELLDVLRAQDDQPPVIMITAHDSPAMRDEVRRRGAACYLPKPFEGGALLAAIDAAANSPETRVR